MGMGAADVVPGVSGGTIAFITGIYEELINSIKSVNLKAVKKLFSKGFKSFWEHVNANFLLAILIGIFISVLTLAKALEYLLVNEPILIWSFFFGLIIASAIVVARKISLWNARTIIAIIAGVAIAYIITEVTPAETTEAYWFIFFSGALAICAMILPGISGSFILLLLGKYQFILNALNQAKFDVIAVLGLGAIIGLLAFSNVLSWLLKKYHEITIAVLAGFMIGSLNKIWPWKIIIETYTDSYGEVKPLIEENVLPGTFESVASQDPKIWAAIGLMLAGFLTIIVMENFTGKKKTV